MAILQRQVNGRRKFKGLTYLHRPTHGKKTLVFQGREFRKVYESLSTDKAYARGLEEKKEEGQSVVWTGEPKIERGQIVARYYGVFVRRHRRMK